MNKEPLISVIIPAYNHPSDLQRAIGSVLRQTWQNFEVLVADDGSEEDIKSVCDSFNDKRIKYLRNKEHKNANAARNRGITEAKGEYIAMLDADDEFLPDHLLHRVNRIREWGCDGIFGSAYIYDGEKEKIKRSRSLKKNENMADYLLTDGFCPTPSHFYKAGAVKKILWDEELYWNQDYDFSIRFAEKFDFRCDPEPTVRVHWHKGHKRKLNDIHFDSQKKFTAKHNSRISLPALVNYFYSMKREAKEIGSEKQFDFYQAELNRIAPYYKWYLILIEAKMTVVVNRIINYNFENKIKR